MADYTIIRGTTLPNSAIKTDCHNLVDGAIITFGNIKNSDISSAAAIADTKLATITTKSKVNLSALSASGASAGALLYSDGTTFNILSIGASGQKLKYGALIDYMEYATDEAAQAAYVSNDPTVTYGSNVLTGGSATASNTDGGSSPANAFDGNTGTYWVYNGDLGQWVKYDLGAGVTKTARRIGVYTASNVNDVRSLKVEGSNNDSDWTTIYTSGTISQSTGWQYLEFANSTAYRYYRITFQNGWGGTVNQFWEIQAFEQTGYASLQDYSESTIKTQGSYSLKGISTTDALNKTLTRTVSPTIDLSNVNTVKSSIYSSRTGSNIKIGLHDSGGTTTEITPNITSAGAWQSVSWDVSGVSNANKDAIDSIIITIVNADEANTFYIDDICSNDLRWVNP